MKKTLFILSIILFSVISCEKDSAKKQCNEGYTGDNCMTEITPSKIFIDKIRITKFPALDNGASWDVGSGPDLYMIVQNYETSDVIFTMTDVFEDAPQQILEYILTTPILLTSIKTKHAIFLLDNDSTSEDDLLGGIAFYPYIVDDGFPANLTIDAGGDVAFELTLSYEW